MPVSAAQAPSACVRSLPLGNVASRIDSAAGERKAPARPCTPRAATSTPELGARPQTAEAAANAASAPMRTRRRPSRSAAFPPSSRKPPRARKYAFATQVRPLSEKPRSAWMEGRATFTIVSSTRSMNCPRQTRRRICRRRSFASDGDMRGDLLRVKKVLLHL
jgi:hypothetical protein